MRTKALGLATALALASGAHAAAPSADRSAALDRAIACRALADATARVACYDAAMDSLQQAQARGELVVMDAERVEAARRESFGMAKSPEPPAPPKARAVDEVSLTVERAWRAPDGDWMLAMADGQVWRHIDGRLARAPQKGSKAEIRRASLGSYLMKLDGQTAVRVRREE